MEKKSIDFSYGLFSDRHIGPNDDQIKSMLHVLGFSKLSEFSDQVIPDDIKQKNKEEDSILSHPVSEKDILAQLRVLGAKNFEFKSWLGMGYSNSILPSVIQRCVFENPGWYTQYTPYQPEISQGRLESLLNFQTMVSDLTGLPIANASLLDEGTAAAEAMMICFAEAQRPSDRSFFISSFCHPQTIEVVKGRAKPFSIEIIVADHRSFDFSSPVFGALLQYPGTDGVIYDYSAFIKKAQEQKVLIILACDLLSLTVLRSPGDLDADIAIGNSQRFGVPLGFGGPHAAFLSTKDELKRRVPGRIVGVSKDNAGQKAIRLALQTREQHIRREKATSNICTAQALLANIASMFAVYHGPDGLRKIAERTHACAAVLKLAAEKCRIKVGQEPFFDTVLLNCSPYKSYEVLKRGWEKKVNLRAYSENEISVSFDETTTLADVAEVLKILIQKDEIPFKIEDLVSEINPLFGQHTRRSSYLKQEVFNSHHSETQMMRYIKRLEFKDLSLTQSMIPLGSCTMKLNAATELMPLSWSAFSQIHPFVPDFQSHGYREILLELATMLAKITGFDSVSLQPNSGAQGEYAGLLVIKKYLESIHQNQRNVCLIPSSAHGTNPATASLANFKVVIVACDEAGNIDLEDLQTKAQENQAHLAALMITYPSTHGVFEASIRKVCDIIHSFGGQVYMDGANLNAQIGLCKPGQYGPDVCHMNLHKTFSIPHGGGGPGAGPIAVKRHLASFLPGHCLSKELGGKDPIRAVSSAPYGSASILLISWSYLKMMGLDGLKKATQVAILNANYIAKRLEPHYKILYKGRNGWVAHECIVDVRAFKKSCGVEVHDIAKRLMDYGFHAPTISFPVAGTMMIEPTESESKDELDRFCDALLAIREEIKEIEDGKMSKVDNPLKNAPHTALACASEWSHPYSREKAMFPLPWVKEGKFWPSVGRIDEAFGDRNLVCTCS